ncbi:MAG: YggT family protein [Rhodobacteraceae bacterium]|nr:YggT family protein [Paracoccaceae bacterium]
MGSIALILDMIISLIFWLLLIYIIMGWLINFDVLNRRQPFVIQVYNGLEQLFTPLLAPIRRILPSAGGLDFSPIVLILGLEALRIVLLNNLL